VPIKTLDGLRRQRLTSEHCCPHAVLARGGAALLGATCYGVRREIGPEPLHSREGKDAGRSSQLGVPSAPHLAFCIFTSFRGFFFLLRHPTLGLFAPSTGFFLLFYAQLAHLFFGGVVLGGVGAHRGCGLLPML
jgi:hypothetical protein